jgi:hypothetical protein
MSSTSTAQHTSTVQHTSAGQHIPRRLPPAGPMMAFERSLHSVPPPARHSPVRLTRRGRVVVLVALLALLLVAFVLGRAGSSEAATHRPGQQAPVTAYGQTTVHEGESLWAVAKRVAPSQDPRAVVLKIRELNHLSSAAVAVGQQLLLPAKA